MVQLICALVLVLSMASPSLGQQSLVGTYKLISIDYEIDGKQVEGLGKAHGYLVLTPTRAVMFYTFPNRKFGTSVEDKVKLYDSLVAWAGAYRIEGKKLIYTVDTSWVEHLNGQNHSLHFQLEGNRLMTTTDPRPWPKDPSKTMVNRRVFEKIE
jgi:hypothetical protein